MPALVQGKVRTKLASILLWCIRNLSFHGSGHLQGVYAGGVDPYAYTLAEISGSGLLPVEGHLHLSALSGPYRLHCMGDGDASAGRMYIDDGYGNVARIPKGEDMVPDRVLRREGTEIVDGVIENNLCLFFPCFVLLLFPFRA